MFRLTELFRGKKLIYEFGLLILDDLLLQFHTWLCFLMSQKGTIIEAKRSQFEVISRKETKTMRFHSIYCLEIIFVTIFYNDDRFLFCLHYVTGLVGCLNLQLLASTRISLWHCSMLSLQNAFSYLHYELCMCCIV